MSRKLSFANLYSLLRGPNKEILGVQCSRIYVVPFPLFHIVGNGDAQLTFRISQSVVLLTRNLPHHHGQQLILQPAFCEPLATLRNPPQPGSGVHNLVYVNTVHGLCDGNKTE